MTRAIARRRSSRKLRLSVNSRRFACWFIGLACILVLSTGKLRAQQTSGSVVGTVSDNAGAVVPNATVTLTNTGTGDRRTATTNGSGDYQFVNLPPSNYSVDIQVSGFKRFTRTNVLVLVQGSTRVDAALAVGDVNQSVTVTSQAPLLETQQATIGQAVAGRAVTELPLNGRDVYNLLALAAGVVPQGQALNGNPVTSGLSTFAWGNYQVSGGIPNTGVTFIDGAIVNSGYINAIALVPTQDSIQEFRVEANNIGPEFGGTTDGVVTMVTKSGTNAFHGSAYDFLRNTVLNANTFFTNQAHLPRPAFIQNQYGGTLGGPIKRDKFFFFGSYEGVRAAIGGTSTSTVPTLLEREGNFAGAAPITDPGSFNSGGTTFVPSAPGTTFAGNMIPADRINSTSQVMLGYWPLPNLPGTTNNFAVTTTTHPNGSQYVARLDWNASEKHRVFGRYTYWNGISPGGLPYGYIDNPSKTQIETQNAVIGDSYTINPKTVLDVRLSYLRYTYFSGAENIPFNIDFTGWPAATIAQMNNPVIPSIQVSGFSGNGGGGQYIIAVEDNDAITGGLTTIRGHHTIRFGGEFRRAPNNYGQTNSADVETFNFTSSFTGNPFASFLLGYPTSSVTENINLVAAMAYYGGAYFGDTFQASNRLTINAGLRWEYPGYWTERHNRQTVFLPNEENSLSLGGGQLPGNVELVNTPAYPHRTNVLPHYDLFSPRLGLAYRLSDSMVVRSGFAILYAPTAAIQQDAQPYQSPVNLAFTQVNATTEPTTLLSNPFPGGILQPVGRSANYLSVVQGQSVVTSVPNEPATYVEQWNLDLQKDLGHQTVFDIAYVANHGVHQQAPAGVNDNGFGLDQIPTADLSLGPALLTPVANPFYGQITSGNLAGPTIPAGQLLRPYPQYYNLNNPANTVASSSYNALQVKIEKRFNQGGTLQANYTWAKDVGTADTQTGFLEGGVQEGQFQNWDNIPGEYSQLSYNVPNRFVLSYVLDLPVGKGKRFLRNQSGLVDKAVSGWGIDGITTLQSGFPLVLTAQPTFISQEFGAGAPRPNVVPNCTKSVSGGSVARIGEWFNTSCFTQPSNYGFGNESRVDSQLRAGGVANTDISFFKGTAINERMNLQFRAEMFNIFNRVQFSYPNTVCCSNTNATFGVVSGQNNAPREIQFALRLSF